MKAERKPSEPTEPTDLARDLESSRERIDRLDHEIVRMLAERMEAVQEIARHKRANPSSPLRDDRRERDLFEFWSHHAAAHGLSGYFAGCVLREVLNWSRREQERFLGESGEEARNGRVRVGYQGVPACYSDLAITKIFDSREVNGVERAGFRDFRTLVEALENGELDYALLPIENTIAGSINEVYDLLAHRDLTIVGEEVWRVEHCLLALPGVRLEDLRVVRSHPVALQQCQRFLEGLVGCTSESWHDTAGAAQSVAAEGRRDVGAIASEEAARHYGLEVLRRDVSNQVENLTRFLLVGREPEAFDPRRPAKTSLVFSVHHHHGALLSCLKVLDEQGINLCKLESRPLPRSPWEYLFYVDFEGDVRQPAVQSALEGLREHTGYLRVLGSYPRRIGEEESPLRHLPSAGAPQARTEDGPEGRGEESAVQAAPARSAPPAPAAPKGPARLVALRENRRRTVVRVGDCEVGGERFVLMAGPCSVESREQILEAAAFVKDCGASILRGGAFKPRTHPYSFQGLGFEGLTLLAEAGRVFELPVVTEVLRPEDVEGVAREADMLQVGARNMQNFPLLKELGNIDRPVLLKRGMSATIEEFLCAAEYVLKGGNQRVILCERGIRTFETATRSTLDLSAVPVLKRRTHLPVIVDPSHAAGERELVIPLALAAAAAGADGLIVEAHPNPAEALSDKEQALTRSDLEELVRRLRPILAGLGRTF